VSTAENSIASGSAALERNDPAAARRHFEQALSQDGGNAKAWYGLSFALRLTGADEDEGAALDRALRINANYLEALIAKGDWHMRRKNSRSAVNFYRTAIDAAKQAGAALPPFWRAEVERIRRAIEEVAASYQAHFQTTVAGANLGSPGTERVSHAIDILMGKRGLYLSQPTHFYFPGLPQKEFFDSSEFSWVGALEAQTGIIRKELEGVLAGGAGILPYVREMPDRANTPELSLGMLNDPGWSSFHLIQNGEEIPENASRCPQTMAALRNVPLAQIKGQSPSALFSILRPGVRIPPHHGFTNARLFCHLPLIVPPNCGKLRVGGESRAWAEGRLMVFDDTMEHEAYNASMQTRVVLLFDIWRPELTPKERELVDRLMTSLTSFGENAQPA
jgi:aspartyl/asparaginyl beta-hydroxylase (cupin superfamily)